MVLKEPPLFGGVVGRILARVPVLRGPLFARVRASEHLGERSGVDARVERRRREVTVPEELLDLADAGTAREEVGRVRVA